MISIRCSSAPLLILCPRSQEPGLRIDNDRQESRLGSAAHEGVMIYERDGEIPRAVELAQKYGVDDVDELGFMLAFARQASDAMRDSFPKPLLEQSFAIQLAHDVELTGTLDKLQVGDNHVAVDDYKSGRRHRDYYAQLLAYALLSTTVFEKPRWSVTLSWLRDRINDTRSGGVAELRDFKEKLVTAARTRETAAYRINEGCDFCPRAANCPARHQLVRQSINDLTGLGDVDFPAIAPKLRDIYTGLRCVEKACEDFRRQHKAFIEANGGKQALPDGGSVEFSESEKRKVLPLLAWPVLAPMLSDAEIAGAMKLSLPDLMDAVAAQAPPRGKGKAKQELVNRLDAVGAIERTTEKRITFKAPSTEKGSKS